MGAWFAKIDAWLRRDQFDRVYQDVRYALRGLRRAPGFTVTVMLTLGLGIGANAAMFAVVDRLMFRSFPYLRDAASVDRVYLQTTARGQIRTQSIFPYTRYLDLTGSTTSFSQSAGFAEWRLAVGVGDDARERQVAGISASFFEFFDARPVIGRFFGASEDAVPSGADVAVRRLRLLEDGVRRQERARADAAGWAAGHDDHRRRARRLRWRLRGRGPGGVHSHHDVRVSA